MTPATIEAVKAAIEAVSVDGGESTCLDALRWSFMPDCWHSQAELKQFAEAANRFATAIAQAAVAACLAGLREEGMCVVPRVASEAMVMAHINQYLAFIKENPGSSGPASEHVWAAMVKAGERG